jgi:hypothetical protein
MISGPTVSCGVMSSISVSHYIVCAFSYSYSIQ